MSPRALTAVAVTLAVLTIAGSARAVGQPDLDKGRAAYVAHQYDEAEVRFRAMVDPASGTHDPALLTIARMYLGAVLVARGKKDETTVLFEKLLLDDPEFEPDPLSFPTEVIDLFIDTRAKLRDKLNAAAQERARREAERRAREEDERRRAAERLVLLEHMAGEERTTELHSRWVALVPFGVGQFQNGQTTLGWFFLASESAVVLGTGVTLPIYLIDLQYRSDAHRQGDDFRAQEYIDRANEVRTVNLFLAGAFATLATVGAIQAEWAYVPEVVDVKKRPLPTAALHLTPTVAPVLSPKNEATGGVVGLTGTF